MGTVRRLSPGPGRQAGRDPIELSDAFLTCGPCYKRRGLPCVRQSPQIFPPRSRLAPRRPGAATPVIWRSPAAPARRAWRRVPPPPFFVLPRSAPQQSAAAACRAPPDTQERHQGVAAFRPAVPPSAPAFRTKPWNTRPTGENPRRPAPLGQGTATSGESSRRNFATAASWQAVRMASTYSLDGLKLSRDQVDW